MGIDEALKDVIVAAFVMGLIPIAYLSYRATKKRAKVGVFGYLAIGVDSLITRSPQMIREMKAITRNKVKKTDPQDEN